MRLGKPNEIVLDVRDYEASMRRFNCLLYIRILRCSRKMPDFEA